MPNLRASVAALIAGTEQVPLLIKTRATLSSSSGRCVVADSEVPGSATSAISSQQLARLLELLTGQRSPTPNAEAALSFPSGGLGYSQLNELLLLLGYDRVSQAFFQFLVDGRIEYEPGTALQSVQDLESGVERARKLALLLFGNVKFGFKKLARDVDELCFKGSILAWRDLDLPED